MSRTRIAELFLVAKKYPFKVLSLKTNRVYSIYGYAGYENGYEMWYTSENRQTVIEDGMDCELYVEEKSNKIISFADRKAGTKEQTKEQTKQEKNSDGFDWSEVAERNAKNQKRVEEERFNKNKGLVRVNKLKK